MCRLLQKFRVFFQARICPLAHECNRHPEWERDKSVWLTRKNWHIFCSSCEIKDNMRWIVGFMQNRFYIVSSSNSAKFVFDNKNSNLYFCYWRMQLVQRRMEKSFQRRALPAWDWYETAFRSKFDRLPSGFFNWSSETSKLSTHFRYLNWAITTIHQTESPVLVRKH